MMNTISATPALAALHRDDGGLAGPTHGDRPEYRHVGNGKFEPANQAAWDECRRFNAWADQVNARAARGKPQ